LASTWAVCTDTFTPTANVSFQRGWCPVTCLGMSREARRVVTSGCCAMHSSKLGVPPGRGRQSNLVLGSKRRGQEDARHRVAVMCAVSFSHPPGEISGRGTSLALPRARARVCAQSGICSQQPAGTENKKKRTRYINGDGRGYNRKSYSVGETDVGCSLGSRDSALLCAVRWTSCRPTGFCRSPSAGSFLAPPQVSVASAGPNKPRTSHCQPTRRHATRQDRPLQACRWSIHNRVSLAGGVGGE